MSNTFKKSHIRKFLNEANAMQAQIFYPDSHRDNMDLDNSHPGEADSPPHVGPDGSISPEELHSHFDVDGDGRVDMHDYAQHVDYHCEHPELLEDYLDLRDSGREDVECHDSYKSCCDHLMSSTSKAMSVIEPLMQLTGGSCASSTASALADVLALLKSKNLI